MRSKSRGRMFFVRAQTTTQNSTELRFAVEAEPVDDLLEAVEERQPLEHDPYRDEVGSDSQEEIYTAGESDNELVKAKNAEDGQYNDAAQSGGGSGKSKRRRDTWMKWWIWDWRAVLASVTQASWCAATVVRQLLAG